MIFHENRLPGDDSNEIHALFVILTLMRHHCGVVCRHGIRCSLLVRLIRDLAQNNMIPRNKTIALKLHSL